MSPEEYFLKAYKISLHAQMVFKVLVCLVLEKNQIEVFACFLKTLILKVVPKAASNFCSGFPLLSLVDLF
jgi:hypothetical protein